MFLMHNSKKYARDYLTMKRFTWFFKFCAMSSFDQRRMLLVQRWGWRVIMV